MKMLTLVALSITLLVVQASPLSEEPVFVKGAIESVTNGQISGWACQFSVHDSIDVRVYMQNSPDNGGLLVKTEKASKLSDGEIAKKCGTTFYQHRFQITLTPELQQRFFGAKVYVQGVPIGGNVADELLDNSGKFRLT